MTALDRSRDVSQPLDGLGPDESLKAGSVKRRSILTPDRRPILTPMDGCRGRPGSP